MELRKGFLALPLLLWLTGTMAGPVEQKSTIAHGLSFHNTLKYPQSFRHFDYANPDAPKGGTLRKGATGTFTTLNTFATKGSWADGSYFLYDPLMFRAGDEPYSVYALVAEAIEYPDDYQWIIYHLNPKARFHDGQPITAEDVLFTFESLQKRGPPHYQHLYNRVEKVEALSERAVRFRFAEPPAKSLVLRLSQLRIVPAHYWQQPDNDLFRSTLKPPLASGPYRVKTVNPGHFVSYERVADYWAADLPVNRGRHNFDLIRTDYYLDDAVALEAFKRGEYDLRIDANPRNWATAYQQKNGQTPFIQEKISNQSVGMRAFVLNLRKPIFARREVRQAIALALDFNWMNEHLFFGMYHQADSLFANSDLAATGLPDATERALLTPWQAQLPPELFTHPWQPTDSDGSGNWRQNKVRAFKLLKEAGFYYEQKTLKDPNGKQLRFEILLGHPEHERFTLPFVRNLRELGIEARINTVDTSQYINRLQQFDFDMISHGFYPSITPGAELKNFWGSASADREAGQNLSGIKLPVLDHLIDRAIGANSRTELINYTRAIDRIVLWHYAVLPLWYLPYWPMVYRPGLERPAIAPPYANGLSTWWRTR